MASCTHYGWETTYPESNEPDSWDTACGRSSFEHYTSQWSQVTCKQCLTHRPRNKLNNRHKLIAGDLWGTPELYRNPKKAVWEPINAAWIGRTVASFNNQLTFVRPAS